LRRYRDYDSRFQYGGASPPTPYFTHAVRNRPDSLFHDSWNCRSLVTAIAWLDSAWLTSL